MTRGLVELDGQQVDPIVSDSRQMDMFDKTLANEKSLGYLERTTQPDLTVAYRMAGGEEWEIQMAAHPREIIDCALNRDGVPVVETAGDARVCPTVEHQI